MKKLIKQQKDILSNYMETDDASQEDYLAAINQHAESLAVKGLLLPKEIGERIDGQCENGCEYIDFDGIRGAYCQYCGLVSPF